MRETDVFLKGYHYVICIRSFLQEIRFLSLSYWWMWLFMFPLESPFPFFFFILSCASMLWIEWISDFFVFVFSLVLFDGLIITLLFCFVNTFLYFYINIFVYYLFYVFIFYYLDAKVQKIFVNQKFSVEKDLIFS